MICPKCGFSQPDDIYCVLCGVAIEKYARSRRKRQYKMYMLIALVGIGVIFGAKHFIYVDNRETPQTTAKQGYDRTEVPKEHVAAHRVKETRAQSARQRFSAAKAVKSSRARPQEKIRRRERSEDDRPDRGRSAAQSQSDQKSTDSGLEQEGGTLTAKQWFQKGVALDDDSEDEMQFYLKAMELDPQFAPAYYRLGAIHYRQADYEEADREFAQFVEYASETDRQGYNIYEYYSLADADSLREDKAKAEGPAEETEQETPAETEAEKEEKAETAGEEEDAETGEEVMTIVKFSSVDGYVVVPVVLNGFLQARVLVDTGAGITVISKEVAQNLRLGDEPDNSITLKTMATDVQAQLGRLDSIQVGDLSRNNFRVAITDFPFAEDGKIDGILGMDFMRSYRIEIDNKRNRIQFTPNAG